MWDETSLKRVCCGLQPGIRSRGPTPLPDLDEKRGGEDTYESVKRIAYLNFHVRPFA